jgi:hypothetical protein
MLYPDDTGRKETDFNLNLPDMITYLRRAKKKESKLSYKSHPHPRTTKSSHYNSLHARGVML